VRLRVQAADADGTAVGGAQTLQNLDRAGLAGAVGTEKAEEIIMSGQVYTAQQMYDAGVIDHLTEDGNGLDFVRAMVSSRQRKRNSYRAMSLAKREFLPVRLAEMKSIVSVWVDAAMRLETRDLRMMARLVRAQDKLQANNVEEEVIERLFAPVQAVANG